MQSSTVLSLKEKILQGNRMALSKGITLCESLLPEHAMEKLNLMEQILPHTGRSLRIGISGIPGAGKSTLIEKLGSTLIEQHKKKVAVLAIDPSSEQSQGSILGDKTRMENLSRYDNAFLRPSPSSNVLGGVGQFTQEAILLCEAAGYDVIFVETVGVGQSEIAVSKLTDIFVVLQLVGAGDELQAMKRGVLEIADIVVVHKADEQLEQQAIKEAATLQKSLRLFTSKYQGWESKVLTASSVTGVGLDRLWHEMLTLFDYCTATNTLAQQRQKQITNWFFLIQQQMVQHFIAQQPRIQSIIKESQLNFQNDPTKPASVIQSMRESLNSLME